MKCIYANGYSYVRQSCTWYQFLGVHVRVCNSMICGDSACLSCTETLASLNWLVDFAFTLVSLSGGSMFVSSYQSCRWGSSPRCCSWPAQRGPCSWPAGCADLVTTCSADMETFISSWFGSVVHGFALPAASLTRLSLRSSLHWLPAGANFQSVRPLSVTDLILYFALAVRLTPLSTSDVDKVLPGH